MKNVSLLLAILIVINVGCKKGDTGGDATCRLRLTSVKYHGGIMPITYNADGTLKTFGGAELRYFNNGQLMVYINQDDTISLDNLSRLSCLKTSFDITDRQIRYYFYDSMNRVVRTVTNTGHPQDYFQDLTYQNGDVVDMVYNVANNGPNSNHFTFSFYDTLCTDQYLAMYNWSQIGLIQNKHLLKSMVYEQDTTYYTYLLDSNKRVLASYRNYDNSGWTYARAVDTTLYYYTCE